MFTELFLDKIPFRDSIRIALDPGSFPPPPLPKALVVGVVPVYSIRFLLEFEAPKLAPIAAALCV